MKRALLVGLALAGLAAGCGGTTTRTVARPPVLPVVLNAETRGGIDGDTGSGARATPPSPYHAASGCGIERWSIKTLTDPGANQVALGTIVPTTVAALSALPAPVNPTDRLAPVETTVYRISGTLTIAKQEADHDYHLVIADGGSTMIVEIPDPACASGSVVASQITQVRSQFVSTYGTPASYPKPDLKPNVPVTVTGIGFFDRIHGQTGVAPNGIELHPLLSLTSP